MVGPRGPTFLLLCFPLIRQVEARDFIVNGATFGAGINPEEGEGADNQRQGWEFKDAGFLVVRGVEPQQNGISWSTPPMATPSSSDTWTTRRS